MARVIQPSQRTYGSDRNKVLRITEARIFAAIVAGNDGLQQKCLLLQFGKNPEDNKPAVFVMANEQEMVEQIKIAPSYIVEGVRAHLAQNESDEVPDDLIGDL
jgi:hypothetical protein